MRYPIVTAFVSLLVVGFPTSTLSQQFQLCTAETDGSFSPHFNIAPSMVVNDDAVLDKTRGDLGLNGNAGERAFSFRRTIAAILESAGGDSGQAAQEAFVQTMLDSFVGAPTFKLNADAGVLMPVDGRQEQSLLTAAEMLDETNPVGMKPLALFNRFDLAPDNWSHCGEHRIIYSRPDTGPRFLLIFEAMVPNPGTGPEGCRPIAEFWAKLSDPSVTSADMASRLSAFYYDGKTSPDLAIPDLLTPVVDYHNYGGDGGRGQVRANAFMTQPWQLREWLIQRTFNPQPGGLPLSFVPVTVKSTPLAELFHDDLTGTDFLNNNIPAAANLVHAQFLQALTGPVGRPLLSETTAKHQQLVGELPLYNLGTGPGTEVTADVVLMNTIALGDNDRFNEFQSTSQGFSDAPGEPAGASTIVTTMLDQIGGATNPFVNSQSGAVLLNRARAVTCGGCHMTAARSQGGGFAPPGVTILKRPDGTELAWPDTLSFVHVDEARQLSPALLNALLPFRRYVLSRFLCEPASTEPAPEPGPIASDDGLYATPKTVMARTVGADIAEKANSGAYFVDALVGSFAANAGTSLPQPVAIGAPMRERSRQVNQIIANMSPAERAALRKRVDSAISLARIIELQRPGAFVEARRPH